MKQIISSGAVLFLVLCGGCATNQVALLNGVSQEGTPICLANPTGIPAVVQRFFATRDLTTEEGKIDYLLDRVRHSDLLFIRNKVEYQGAGAADFLRWKLNRMEKRYHVKVKTAQDFISQVTGGSRTSGEPYTVVLSDGSRHNLQNVLQNELSVLESCLKQLSSQAEKASSGSGSDAAPAVTGSTLPAPLSTEKTSGIKHP